MMAFSQDILGPLEELAASVKVVWPEILTSELQESILHLTNKILEKEDTIGFSAPLNEQEGSREISKLANAVESGDIHLLLLQKTDTSEIIGHLILSPSKLPNCLHIAEISRAMVHPDYRGFSAILLGMYEVLHKCEALNVEIIQLDVRANTRIHRLWEGLGFRTIGLMEDYARVNGESYSGCFMYQHVKLLQERFLKPNE